MVIMGGKEGLRKGKEECIRGGTGILEGRRGTAISPVQTKILCTAPTVSYEQSLTFVDMALQLRVSFPYMSQFAMFV
jgi:hypothetical protein